MNRFIFIGLLCCAQALAQAPVSEPADSEPTETDAGTAAEAVAPEPAPPEPAPYRDREHRDMSLLAQSLPDDQVLWVDGQEGEVLALYLPAISSEPVGAILLVQDQDLHSLWPKRLDGLRRYLPEHGWSTMLVSLPAPDPLPLPARPPEPEPPAMSDSPNEGEAAADATGEQAPRPETEEVFDDSTDQVAHVDDMQQDILPEPDPVAPSVPAGERADQRLAQAIDALHDRGQFNLVLLVEGAGAVRAARLTEAMNYDGFRALVLLDARNSLPGESGDVLAMVKESNVPVLDTWASAHHSDPRDNEARRHTARRAGLDVYQQLPMPTYEPGQLRLYKRVRGFIDKYARGVKVDNAEVVRSP